MTALEEALGELVGGRVDVAHLCAATGLLVLGVRTPAGKRLLGVGIGPRVRGVGWLPGVPRGRAPSTHPLVASMRAHLVGKRVEDAGRDGTAIVLDVGLARLRLGSGRRGHALVLAGDSTLRWPPSADPAEADALHVPADLEAAGATLLAESDRIAGAQEVSDLARAVARAVRAVGRRIAAIEGDLARLATVGDLQRTGRMLLAQGGRVPRGATRAVLEDWETGGTLEVELDPTRGAKEQAESFFAKARRWQRGEAIGRRRLGDARNALRDLEQLAAELAAEPDNGALEALRGRARGLGVRDGAAPEPPGERSRGGRAPPARLPFVRHRDAAGREILVGRGAADNDELTTRYARPGDLWLHAKNRTGAHVVVPLTRGESCPSELLVDAATLAAHYSDARGEGVCEVSYVERRFVRKRRGSPPGAVTLDREKVIVLRVEQARLARLLESKEEPR